MKRKKPGWTLLPTEKQVTISKPDYPGYFSNGSDFIYRANDNTIFLPVSSCRIIDNGYSCRIFFIRRSISEEWGHLCQNLISYWEKLMVSLM